MKKLTLYLTLICFFCSTIPASKAFAANTDYEEALRLFAAIEYRKAEPLLLKALSKGALSAAEIVKARECLAEIYVATSQDEKAVEQYRLLLDRDLSYSLSSDASPSLRQAYSKARAKMPPVVATKETPKQKPIEKKTAISSKTRKTLGWTLVGVGGGLLVGGCVSYLLAGQKDNVFKNANRASDAKAARHYGQTYETIGMTSLGLGAASTGVGIYFLASPSGKKSAAASDSGMITGFSSDGHRHTALFGWAW